MPDMPGLAGVVSVAGELTYLLDVSGFPSFAGLVQIDWGNKTFQEKEHSEDLQHILKDHKYALDKGKSAKLVL